MRILILGGGSREHALAHVLSKSPECEKLYLAPGNAGTDEIALNLDLKENNFQGIKEAVLDKQIDLVIPGPEKPLIEGIVDFFRDDPDLYTEQIVGPDQKAAWLEGSKAFAKDFMKRHQIPTGGYHVFQADQYEEALNTLSEENPPYVIKADGLAAGKGVTICSTKKEAEDTLHAYMVDQQLGEAANQVVIET
jgi:phosphoribosylamine--glycine ligase